MTDRSTWRPLPGSPGFYTDDDGTIHVDEDEAIRGTGHLPTPQSRRALRRAVRVSRAPHEHRSRRAPERRFVGYAMTADYGRRYDGRAEHADWCADHDHEGKCLDRLLERIGYDVPPTDGSEGTP